MLNTFKKARLIAGFTQAQLAREVGVTPGAVCQWEKGRVIPSAGRLKKVAGVLGTTVSDLLAEPEGKEVG